MGEPVDREPTVLIVADSEDSREVLRTALSRRGIAVIEAGERMPDAPGDRSSSVDLVVIDIESYGSGAESIPNHLKTSVSQDASTELLILGTARLPPSDLRRAHVVSKPYHYGAVIRKIEELLAAR